jgi:hypothetical protein
MTNTFETKLPNQNRSQDTDEEDRLLTDTEKQQDEAQLLDC